MLEDQGSWYDADGSEAVQQEHRLRGCSLCPAAPETRLESPTPSCTSAASTRSEPERMRALAEEALLLRSRGGRRRAHRRRADSLRALSFPIVDVDVEIAEIAALYRKVGDIHGLASLYHNAGYVAIAEGSYERAAAYLDEALVLAREDR